VLGSTSTWNRLQFYKLFTSASTPQAAQCRDAREMLEWLNARETERLPHAELAGSRNSPADTADCSAPSINVEASSARGDSPSPLCCARRRARSLQGASPEPAPAEQEGAIRLAQVAHGDDRDILAHLSVRGWPSTGSRSSGSARSGRSTCARSPERTCSHDRHTPVVFIVVVVIAAIYLLLRRAC